MCERPAMELVEGNIDVGLEARAVVDEIEVAALTAPYFDRDDILRRTVKLLDRKGFDDRRNVAHRERNDDVDVMGHAWLAIRNPGGASGDHVGNPEPFEPRDKRLDETRLQHAGRSFARARPLESRSSRGGARARGPRAIAARTSTAGSIRAAAPRGSSRDNARSAPVTAGPRAPWRRR